MTTPAITPFLVGTGVSIALFALKSEISHPLQQSITTHRPLDKFAKLGDFCGKVYPNLIYAAYGLISGWAGQERGFLRAEEMALATAYSGAVTSVLKVSFREARPNSPDGADKKSMPSGHATTAFAFAGIVGVEHPWYIGVPAYLLAVNTAYSRINDNKHYLHDVVAGATIGLSYALGVYYKRLDRDGAKTASIWPTFSIQPSENLDGAILGAARRF